MAEHEHVLSIGDRCELILSRSVEGNRVSFRFNLVDHDSGRREPLLWLGPVPIDACELAREPHTPGYVWLFVELGLGAPPVRFGIQSISEPHELRAFLGL